MHPNTIAIKNINIDLNPIEKSQIIILEIIYIKIIYIIAIIPPVRIPYFLHFFVAIVVPIKIDTEEITIIIASI